MGNVAMMTVACGFLSFAIRSIVTNNQTTGRPWSDQKRAQLSDMKLFTHAFVPGGAAFVVFMCCVDIPMYIHRTAMDDAQAKQYMTMYEGLLDATHCREVSFRSE